MNIRKLVESRLFEEVRPEYKPEYDSVKGIYKALPDNEKYTKYTGDDYEPQKFLIGQRVLFEIETRPDYIGWIGTGVIVDFNGVHYEVLPDKSKHNMTTTVNFNELTPIGDDDNESLFDTTPYWK